MDTADRETEKILGQLEKDISSHFKTAEKEMREKWDEYLNAEHAEIDKLQSEYEQAKASGDKEAAKKSGARLKREKRAYTLQNERFNSITENLAAGYTNANVWAAELINGRLPQIYGLNYNYISKGIKRIVKGYSFSLLNIDVVKNLFVSDKSLLPLMRKVKIADDKKWNMKAIRGQVLQGILQGESMDKIAARLQRVTDMNDSSARRNARTAVTGSENRGRIDGFERAAKMGINVEKQWLATKDARTRESHAAINGEHVPYDKKFGNGLLYPGDPDGRPEELHNCRCTIVAYFPGFE